MRSLFKTFSTFLMLVAVSLPANASSMGSDQPLFPAEQIIKFAKKVEKTLAAKGAHVAILARMGRPASELPE